MFNWLFKKKKYEHTNRKSTKKKHDCRLSLVNLHIVINLQPLTAQSTDNLKVNLACAVPYTNISNDQYYFVKHYILKVTAFRHMA